MGEQPRRGRIFCYLSTGRGTDRVGTLALAEDGTYLAARMSASEGRAKADIGCGYAEETNHTVYSAHYPDGYDLEWVEDPESHDGVKSARRRAERAVARRG